VDADDGGRGVNVAHHQRDKFFNFVLCSFAGVGFCGALGTGNSALKAENAESSPAGGEIGFGDLLYAFKCHVSILLCGRLRGVGRGSHGLLFCPTHIKSTIDGAQGLYLD
jgi:hypothetical protein